MRSVADDDVLIHDEGLLPVMTGKEKLLLFWQTSVYYHKQEITLNTIYILQMVYHDS